jgi:hypothetical protein
VGQTLTGGGFMSGIVIPVSVGLRGDVKMIMRNVVTGEVETREMRNTILNLYKNRLFNQTWIFSDGFLSSAGRNVRIGTSNQAASPTDTGIIGTQLATKAGTEVYSGTNPQVKTITAVFPAGTGTGTVQEVVLAGNVAAARQVVSPALNKTAQHELTVVWTLSLSRSADSYSGTITGGQRDGITDIDWTLTINDKQLDNWARLGSTAWTNGFSILTGDSNAASDLVNDGHNTIKGTQLFSGAPAYTEPQTYTADSFYRDVRLGLDINQSNGSVKELILQGGSYRYGLFRITFDPGLDKVDTYRLYLTFRLAVVNAS